MKTHYPKVEHGIVNRASGSLFSYQGWPTVARDEKGTLYVVSSSFRAGHICPFGKTALYVSHDEGNSWSPPTVINDTYLDDRDAGILYMGNGRLLVTWFTHSADAYQTVMKSEIRKFLSDAAYTVAQGVLDSYDALPEHARMSGSYVRISEDYGKTWGETIYVPINAPHGPTLCKDGTLIYLGCNFYKDDRIHLRSGEDTKIACFASRDGGYTWEKRSTVAQPKCLLERGEYLCEPHVIELADGRLLGAYRIQGKPLRIATAISSDQGRSWGEITYSDTVGSPPHLMIHSSGALICTFGRRKAPFGMRAKVSYDNGLTWDKEYVLDERFQGWDMGYPSTVELSDGSLLTVYYQRVEGDDYCSILYTKWRVAD